VSQGENHRAIYVGYSQKRAGQVLQQAGEKVREKLACFTVSGDDTNISDAEYFFLPKLALQLAQQLMKEHK
jgi:hypothetical protein